MDPIVFNFLTWTAGSLVVALVGYLFYRLHKAEDRHESLDKDFRTHLAEVPMTYVAKGDLTERLRGIEDGVRELRGDIKSLMTVMPR